MLINSFRMNSEEWNSKYGNLRFISVMKTGNSLRLDTKGPKKWLRWISFLVEEAVGSMGGPSWEKTFWLKDMFNVPEGRRILDRLHYKKRSRHSNISAANLDIDREETRPATNHHHSRDVGTTTDGIIANTLIPVVVEPPILSVRVQAEGSSLPVRVRELLKQRTKEGLRLRPPVVCAGAGVDRARKRCDRHTWFTSDFLSRNVAGFSEFRQDMQRNSKLYVEEAVRMTFTVLFHFSRTCLRRKKPSIAEFVEEKNIDTVVDWLTKRSEYDASTKYRKVQYLASGLRWMERVWKSQKLRQYLNCVVPYHQIVGTLSAVSVLYCVVVNNLYTFMIRD